MKVLLVHPGSSVSVADVEDGLRTGLEAHGVTVHRYRLDHRLAHERDAMLSWQRYQAKHGIETVPVTPDDVNYRACVGALEMALRLDVDVVVIVAGLLFHPDVLVLMRRAGVRTAVLLTESPYDPARETTLAALVDGVWTNDKSAVATFKQHCPNVGYLPHAWHPVRHRPEAAPPPRHDVVFVGTAWQDRIDLFSAVDWTGIDLALYGNWTSLLPKRHPLRSFVKGPALSNIEAVSLYREARINLNLHRGFTGWGRADEPTLRVVADSLNPRAYELAALGVFWISDDTRAEQRRLFGDAVPRFRDADDLSALIRRWLPDAAGRAELAAQGPLLVARESWTARAGDVKLDLESLIRAAAARRQREDKPWPAGTAYARA